MNKKKIGIVTGILLLIESGFTLSMASGELKVGCVDIQRTMNECQAGVEGHNRKETSSPGSPSVPAPS